MKHILVTGSGGGMGNAICRLLIKNGYHVIGLDYKPDGQAEGTDFVICDVTSVESVERARGAVTGIASHIDAIVHTAGIYDLDSLIEMDEVRFVRIFNVNLFGVYRINRAFAPMLSSGGRIIITTSELAPLDPLPFTGIYGITKTALEKYAFSLRMELNLLDMKVIVIRPGAVKTGLLGDSTRALDRFCNGTEIYRCNAAKFKRIVDTVEARNVSPKRVAGAVLRALSARRPQYIYNLNRNPLLRMLNVLPARMQTAVIKTILKTD